jgi:hypothetical protein
VFLGEFLRGVDDDQRRGVWTGPVPRWTFYALGLIGSILVVWTAPTWARTFPLFVLGALIFVDRRWLGEPDKSGKGLVAWSIRLLSWSCLIGFVVIGSLFASLGVHYYYNAAPESPAWAQDKELLGTLAMAATIAGPLLLALVIVTLRRFTPRVYLFVRDWLLGKRLWLTMGFFMHVGIDLTMNVGTFVQVMIAVYPAWLAGSDVEAWWRYVLWRPAKPGEGGRPPLPASKLRRVGRKLVAPFERAKYRVRRPAWVVLHAPAESAVRRVALLRCWDIGARLEFELDAETNSEVLRLRSPDGKTLHVGARAGRELVSLLPGLWWLWPISMFPGVGRLATLILRQRVG